MSQFSYSFYTIKTFILLYTCLPSKTSIFIKVHTFTDRCTHRYIYKYRQTHCIYPHTEIYIYVCVSSKNILHCASLIKDLLWWENGWQLQFLSIKYLKILHTGYTQVSVLVLVCSCLRVEARDASASCWPFSVAFQTPRLSFTSVTSQVSPST